MTMKIEGGKVVIPGPITAQELAFRVRKFKSLFGMTREPLITIRGRWDKVGILRTPDWDWLILDLRNVPRPVTYIGRLYVRIDMTHIKGGYINAVPERGVDVVVELALPQ